MPNLSIENVGRFGLHTDKEPFEIPVEAWSRADNIRFDSLGASKIKGHAEVLTGILHAPYWFFPWDSSTGFSWLYAGLTRIGRIVGAGHSDVTRFTSTLGDDDYAASASSIFSGTLLGDLPIWCYDGEVDPPQSFNTGNSRFEDLPNWQASSFADILTVVDRHVVALRIKRSGIDFNPRMVKWSQAADPGTYPNSWDETDPATGAGEVTLAETQGEIIAVALLGNSTLIYKQDSIITMRFIGGQNIFRFDTMFSQFGAIGRHAVGILEKAHVVVTFEGDVIIHNGSTFKSIINDKNRNLLFSNMAAAYKQNTQVIVRLQDTEVWICYADSVSTGFLNKVLIWNYQDDTWSFRDLQDFSFLAVGFIDTDAVSGIFDNAPQTTTTFNTALNLFDAQSSAPVFDDIAAVDATNSKIYKLNSTEQFDGVNIFTRLERIGLPIIGRDRQGNWKIDLDTRKYITRLYLKLIATGPIDIYVGGQERANGPVTWTGPFSFDPNIDTHIDFRVNTRFFAVRFESASNISWTLYGYTFKLILLGEVSR